MIITCVKITFFNNSNTIIKMVIVIFDKIMVNIYIYLNKDHDANALVSELLRNELVAHASIDENNNSMIYENGEIKNQVCSLITAQTKALLFNEVIDFVNMSFKNHIKIYSAPITQCNETFSELIRKNTKFVQPNHK